MREYFKKCMDNGIKRYIYVGAKSLKSTHSFFIIHIFINFLKIPRRHDFQFKKKLFIYLNGRVTKKEGETEGERNSFHPVIHLPQMATTARAGQGQSQEPTASSKSLMWIAGDIPPLLSQAFSKELGQKWSSQNSNWQPYEMLLVTGDSLTC